MEYIHNPQTNVLLYLFHLFKSDDSVYQQLKQEQIDIKAIPYERVDGTNTALWIYKNGNLFANTHTKLELKDLEKVVANGIAELQKEGFSDIRFKARTQ